METENSVGFVVEIEGTRVRARMLANTNNLTYYRNGQVYRGIGIGEYVGIQRGPYKLVGKVVHEYLKDINQDFDNQEFATNRFIREIDISIIGAFRNNKFKFGISIFPQIFAEIILLNSDEIYQVLTGNRKNSWSSINIGKTIPEGIGYSVDLGDLFNTHFAIFGNTGSGKSNTLAKLYTELFTFYQKRTRDFNDSKFIFLDFNGEYTKPNTLTPDKLVLKLDTSVKEGVDKIKLPKSEFWDPEMLSILFLATKQTQEPFLRSTLNYFKPEQEVIDKEKMINFLVMAFQQVFLSTHKDEKSLELLKIVLNDLNVRPSENKELSIWLTAKWNGTTRDYYIISENKSQKDSEVNPKKGSEENSENKIEVLKKKGEYYYFSNATKQKFQKAVRNDLTGEEVLDENIWIDNPLVLLSVLVHLEMIYKLSYGYNQFEFINPLLTRIESRKKMFNKIIQVSDEDNFMNTFCTVISLRNVNREAKDIIPLLVSRYVYRFQKRRVQNLDKIDKIINLIIDEAHNILSVGKSREADKWQDYRLDVFEEIIKEGRKFGFYLIIASQRPADISATIVSQMHNFIIHRLVNENDLRMLDYSLNSLDRVSKSAIPTLVPGSAIFTGTSFPLPVMVQVDALDQEKSPQSDNVDLNAIWHC